MIEIISEPLGYAFMLRALAGAVLVGIVCAIVGTYVVLRGMAFFGDALAHSILPGVAVGYLLSQGGKEQLFWWALLAALISSLGIGAISRNTKIREDTAIGVVFAGMFAMGIVLISTVRNYAVDLSHFLFGDVLGVRPVDLWMILIFGGLIILVIMLFYKELLVLSFDPLLAVTLRLPATALDYLLMILISVTIVVSLQTVGVALMVAMLITPAATAFMLTHRMPVMMGLAALIASAAGVVGLYLSYYFNIASGAAIVLTATSVFFAVWGVKSLVTRLQRV